MLDLEEAISLVEDAIDIVEKEAYWTIANGLRDVIAMLKEQDAKTGHWIDTTKVIGFPRVQCSVCGSGQGAIWMNYCPNCGAKMEGR